MDNTILVDSLNLVLPQVQSAVIESTESSVLDTIYKIAMCIIAACNLMFAIFIFRSNKKKNEEEKECDRKIGLLKTVILDHNLKNLYLFYDKLEDNVQGLKDKNLSIEKRTGINESLGELFTWVRRHFIDSLLVDAILYNMVLDKFDKLQDHITEVIFDEGVNLSHEPKFDTSIEKKIIENQTLILKMLFDYRG